MPNDYWKGIRSGLVLILMLLVCCSAARASAINDLKAEIRDLYSSYDKLINLGKSEEYFARLNEESYLQTVEELVQNIQNDLSGIDLYASRALAEGDCVLPAPTKGLPSFEQQNQFVNFQQTTTQLKELREKISAALELARRTQAKLQITLKVNAFTLLFKAFGTYIFTPVSVKDLAGGTTELLLAKLGTKISSGGQPVKSSPTISRLRELQDDPAIKELEAALAEAKAAAEKKQGLKDEDIIVLQKKLVVGYGHLIRNYTEVVKIINESLTGAEQQIRLKEATQKSLESRIREAFANSKWWNNLLAADIAACLAKKGRTPKNPGPSIIIPPASSGPNYPVTEADKARVNSIIAANEKVLKDIYTKLNKPYLNLIQIINRHSKYNKDSNLNYYNLPLEKRVSFYSNPLNSFLQPLESLTYAMSGQAPFPFARPSGYQADREKYLKQNIEAILVWTKAEQLAEVANIDKQLAENQNYFSDFVKKVDFDFADSLKNNQLVVEEIRQQIGLIQMTGFKSPDSYFRDKLLALKKGIEAREGQALADEHKWQMLLAEKPLVISLFQEDFDGIAAFNKAVPIVKRSMTAFSADFESALQLRDAMEAAARKGKELGFLDNGKNLEEKIWALYSNINSLFASLGSATTLTKDQGKKMMATIYSEYSDDVVNYLYSKIMNSGYFVAPERNLIQKFYESGYVEKVYGPSATGPTLTIKSLAYTVDRQKTKDDLATYQKVFKDLEKIVEETNKTLGYIKAGYSDRALGTFKEPVSHWSYTVSAQIDQEFWPFTVLVNQFADEVNKPPISPVTTTSTKGAEVKSPVESDLSSLIERQQSTLTFKLIKSQALLREMTTIKKYFDSYLSQNNISLASSIYLASLDRKAQSAENKTEADDLYVTLANYGAKGLTKFSLSSYKAIGDNDYKIRSKLNEMKDNLSHYVADISNLRESAGNIGEGFDLEEVIAGRGPVVEPSSSTSTTSTTSTTGQTIDTNTTVSTSTTVFASTTALTSTTTSTTIPETITNGAETLVTGANFDFSAGGITVDPNNTDIFYAVGDQFWAEDESKCSVQDYGASNFSTAPLLSPGSSNKVAVVVGHYYAVLTMENNYGKLKVTGKDVNSVTFDWWYQTNGTRNF